MQHSNDLSKIKLPDILYYSYYTLGPSSVSPYHSHSYYELTYMFECEGVYLIDGKEHCVSKGDIILFPPGCKHGEILDKGQQFNIFVAGLEGFNFEDIPNFYENLGHATPFIQTGELKDSISNCYEEIRREIQCCETGHRQIVKSLIDKIVVLLIRSKSSKNFKSNNSLVFSSADYSNKRQIVDRIKNYIDFYYSSRIYLEDIVHNVYLSPTYVIKIFKEETGETPISYLIKVRMCKAKELLRQGKFTLAEISQMVGYDDTVHFCKMFKKFTGFSPRQYSKTV
jgi:AraC-like DNA-binding protein